MTNLKYLRLKNKRTQQEIAQRTDIPRWRIALVEAGAGPETLLNSVDIQRLGELFAVDPKILFKQCNAVPGSKLKGDKA